MLRSHTEGDILGGNRKQFYINPDGTAPPNQAYG